MIFAKGQPTKNTDEITASNNQQIEKNKNFKRVMMPPNTEIENSEIRKLTPSLNDSGSLSDVSDLSSNNVLSPHRSKSKRKRDAKRKSREEEIEILKIQKKLRRRTLIDKLEN